MHMLNAFEENVADSLKELLEGECPESLAVAVSGGADSVSLLVSLYNILRAKKFSFHSALSAVTVDHSIRPEAETAGDAAFVKDLCASLGIKCIEKKLPRGFVSECAEERGRGMEDAARFLRYRAFEETAKEIGAKYICLAHNKNDLTETILMRFLQGAPASSSRGIVPRRGIYLRPLLNVTRAEIESYLREKNILWRTDASNFDDRYLRNKIRNKLVPFLNDTFKGWQKAVLQGAQKAALESFALESMEKGFVWKSSDDSACPSELFTSALDFSKYPAAVRERLVYRALDELGTDGRIPYGIVHTVSLWPEKDFKNISCSGIQAFTKNLELFIKKEQKGATESGFFDIISGEGIYDFEAFRLETKKAVGGLDLYFYGKTSAQVKGVETPFVVRSAAPGDGILTADKSLRALTRVFSDWKVDERQKNKIPVIIENGKIKAVLGSVLGFDDWVVK